MSCNGYCIISTKPKSDICPKDLQLASFEKLRFSFAFSTAILAVVDFLFISFFDFNVVRKTKIWKKKKTRKLFSTRRK